jgi:hypothetical protein
MGKSNGRWLHPARRIAANIAELLEFLTKGAIFRTACWLGCATGASSSDGIGF